MRFIPIACMVAVLSLAVSASSQDLVVTEKVVLKYQRSSKIMKVLFGVEKDKRSKRNLNAESVAEILSASGSDVENSITVTGKSSAIRDFREVIRLLDVRSKSLTLEFKIFRVHVDETGKKDERLINQPTVTTLNNEEVVIATRGDSMNLELTVIPRINGDESVSIFTSINVDENAKLRAGTLMRRVIPGKSSYYGGVTDSKDPAVQAAASSGGLPQTAAAYTIYRVYVTPTINPAK